VGGALIVIDSNDEDFEQPSDEDSQGNVLSIRIMDIDGEDDIKQTPNKKDAKSAVKLEEQTPTSPERQERHLRKHDDETEKMKKLFTTFAANTQKETTIASNFTDFNQCRRNTQNEN
jgi:hypothetical protein